MEDLKRWLGEKRQQLENKRIERRGYMDTADKITVIYDRMSDDKTTIEGYRDNVRRLKDEDFGTFKGYNHDDKYETSMDKLVKNYETVIKNLDTNMDRLNTARKDFENKAYACDPIIGRLEQGVNSLIHQIENWVN